MIAFACVSSDFSQTTVGQGCYSRFYLASIVDPEVSAYFIQHGDRRWEILCFRGKTRFRCQSVS